MPDSDSLTREEREALLELMATRWKQVYPPPGQPRPARRDKSRFYDDWLKALGDYADGMPRVVLSACPLCAEPLRQAFDPYGLEGPWWHENRLVEFEEPDPCEHFRVILGAVKLAGDVPNTGKNVRPGPEVPFVVPRLLAIQGMIAVVGSVVMETGDLAYPIAYFSPEPVSPIELHQPWCQSTHWFTNESGQESWTIHNDVWDFELQPYVDVGKLCWVLLDQDGEGPRVRRAADGEPCPFVDLPGERRPQLIAAGEREFLGPPSGKPILPFLEAEDEESE